MLIPFESCFVSKKPIKYRSLQQETLEGSHIHGLSSQTPVLDRFFRHKTRLKKDEHLQGEEIISSELVFSKVSQKSAIRSKHLDF